MDFDAIDHRGELRQGVEARFNLAPVVVCLPVAHETLDGHQLHALRLVADDLPFRILRRRQAPAQVDEFALGHMDAEWFDFRGRGGRGWAARQQIGHTGRNRPFRHGP